MSDIDRLRQIAAEATPGPWGYNSYSAIFSHDRGHDEWQDARLDEGHTLEGRLGASECPTCGHWTWSHTNPKTGEVTTYDGRGCRLYTEDYDRDPLVASVPAHHGDTATGRHSRDAEFIATARNEWDALLDRLEAAEAAVARVRAILVAWEAWDGSPGPDGDIHPDASSPRDRDRLRAALDGDPCSE